MTQQRVEPPVNSKAITTTDTPKSTVAGMPVPSSEAPPGFDPNAPLSKKASRRIQRRRRKRRGTWLVPVVFGLGLFAAVFCYQKYFGAALRGELTATVVDDADFEPTGLIHRDLSGISKSRTDAVLEALATQSRQISTSLMVLDIQGGKRGITVYLQNGRETQFYKARIDTVRELQKYCDQHIAEMDQYLHEALSAAAKRFFLDYEQSWKDGEKLKNLVDYRDTLFMNAMVGGLGYYVQARVGQETFPCVFEDNEAVYFLLKPGIEEFEVIGRELPNGTTPFPGHYTACVTRDK